MARSVGIGIQNFEKLIINRPRRFGKTLNMNMLERFLSIEYAGGVSV